MQIFLARDNQQAGPYTLEQLNTMLADGQVQLTDLAWHEGMEKWQQLGEITGGMSYYDGVPAPQTVPPVVLADTPTPAQQSPQHPSFGRRKADKDHEVIAVSKGKRIGASMLDFAIFLACFLPVIGYIKLPKELAENPSFEQQMQLAQQMISQIPNSAITFVNFAILAFITLQMFLLVRRGQTIGKSVVGIRIVDATTNKLASSFAILFKRFLLTAVVFYLLILLTGPLALAIYAVMVWFSKDGKLPHDKLANTILLEAREGQLEK